jgi:hypothetical protein
VFQDGSGHRCFCPIAGLTVGSVAGTVGLRDRRKKRMKINRQILQYLRIFC